MFKFSKLKNYLTWILLFFMWLLAKLPFSVQRLLSYFVGFLLYYLLHKRRHIAQINISLCFADQSKKKQHQLLKSHFNALGLAVVTMANTFYLPQKYLDKLVSVNGSKHLEGALNRKEPIILMFGHFTSSFLINFLGGKFSPMAIVFRPQNNLLFDYTMRKHAIRHGLQPITLRDTKTIIKVIKSGIPIVYVPDQDLGKDNSVFAPLFDVKKATVVATHKLAKLTKACVIPVVLYSTDNGYIFEFQPPIENYPTSDILADTILTNKILEEQIKHHPEQYLWIHRCFKTREDDQEYLY